VAWGVILFPWLLVPGGLTAPDAIHFVGSASVGLGLVRHKGWTRPVGWVFVAYCLAYAWAYEVLDLRPKIEESASTTYLIKTILNSWIYAGVGVSTALVLWMMSGTLVRSSRATKIDA